MTCQHSSKAFITDLFSLITFWNLRHVMCFNGSTSKTENKRVALSSTKFCSNPSIDNVRHCRYCVSHHASREFQYSCFIFLSKLTRFLLWVLYFVASCVTWVTLLYSDSCVTWHLTLYLNLYNVRILLCHVRCSVQGNVQCRVPRKINKKNNVLE